MQAGNFSFKNIKIWKVGEENGEPYAFIYKQGIEENPVVAFQYHEDIFDIGYKATLVLTDRGANLPGTMPIQGFEKVTVEVQDYRGDTYEYAFRVWKVGNRVETAQKRMYTLGLVSESILVNESVFVNKVLAGTPTSIVRKLLVEYLKVSGARLELQESINNIKLIPASKSPFAIIRELQAKSLSKASVEPATSTKVDTSAGESPVSSDSPKDASQLKGTAGFFFYETATGFKFKSVDSIISSDENKFGGSGPVAVYKFGPKNIDTDEAFDPFKIQEVVFGSEIDLFKKLRQGSYSSLCCFFNINTGKYEEYVYKLSDMWDKMAHLGKQSKLPYGQSTISKYPTRIFSTVINHENWYNGTEIASNEDGDAPATFTDCQKQYLLQAIARAGLLFNQQLTISVTGNLSLMVGDKIDVRLPNQVSEAAKAEEGSLDPEHSGIYLIRKVSNIFDNATKKCDTVLELIRDSIGHEESKVK